MDLCCWLTFVDSACCGWIDQWGSSSLCCSMHRWRLKLVWRSWTVPSCVAFSPLPLLLFKVRKSLPQLPASRHISLKLSLQNCWRQAPRGLACRLLWRSSSCECERIYHLIFSKTWCYYSKITKHVTPHNMYDKLNYVHVQYLHCDTGKYPSQNILHTSTIPCSK